MATNIYKCKNCTGDLEFDPKIQKLRCPFCESTFDLSEYADNDKTKENSRDESKETEKLTSYICSTCKGEIITDGNETATFCPFCGNSTIISSALDGKFLPETVIPFTLNVDDAKNLFLSECKKRRFCPKEFASKSTLKKITGIYVPFYLYDCETNADITFEGTKSRSYTSGEYRITEISYYDLERSGHITFNKIPADSSSKMDDLTMSSLEPFDFTKKVDFSTMYLSGFFAEKNDVEKSERLGFVKNRTYEAIEDYLTSTTYSFESVRSVKKNINSESTNIELTLAPVYVLNTTYKGESYQFAVNGQTGKFIGKFPVNKGKFWSYTAKILLLVYILTFAGYFIWRLT